MIIQIGNNPNKYQTFRIGTTEGEKIVHAYYDEIVKDEQILSVIKSHYSDFLDLLNKD